MMKKILKGIFGWAEKPAPPSTSTVVINGEKIDMEYVKYCIEQDRTVSTLEARLHKSDDPKEIAEESLKAACLFYGGDWAGILDVDLDLDVWTPLWWYNASPHDRTTALFGEFELAKYMTNWIESLKTGSPVCITNVRDIQYSQPEEYAIYKRLEVESVIGVPFGPNPVGILAIRNPTRYAKYSSALSVFAYVIHRAMAQQKTIDSSKLALSPDEIKSDKDIIVNFFGSMEICTSAGVLTERAFNSPRSSRVVTYLLLNRKSSFYSSSIVSALWPEEEGKWETLSSYVRNYIHTFKKAFDLVSPYPLIVSTANGYGINPDLNIMTDLQQFELLCDNAQHTPIIQHKIELMKKAADLYKGDVFENAKGEFWIDSIATHYRLRYIGIVNELLATLDAVNDFAGVQQYAAKAIMLTPENARAHYWMIHAMNHLGTLELARNQITFAKGTLTSEEYSSLKKFIAEDPTMPYTVLFGSE